MRGDETAGSKSKSLAVSNLWQRLSRGMEVVIYLLLLLSVYKLFGTHPPLNIMDGLLVFNVPHRRAIRPLVG